MPYSLLLEHAYLAIEYGRQEPSRKRIVGTLLDSAFEDAPHDPELERLCAMLPHDPRAIR